MSVKKIFALVLLIVSVSPAFAAELRDIVVDFSTNPDPLVGTPTQLSFSFKDPVTGKPLQDLQVKLEIVIVEDALNLFSGNFYVPDGRLDMTYHFQDATEHAINLVVSPGHGSGERFLVSRTFLVDVMVPEPPTRVWFKTLLFLMSFMVGGIVIGYYTVRARGRDA